MSGAFESSSAGALPDDARLECGVCWWVYDPAKGEDTWDTPPGRPFTALKADWRCPSCDAPKSKFMALAPGVQPRKSGPLSLEARIAQLTAAYERAEDNMVGLPVHNDKLEIDAVGFQVFEDGYLGVVATPWSMNLTYVPADPDTPAPAAIGASMTRVFPSGSYNFIVGRMDGV
ncbi:MAG: [NiFe]-hydrogenase assembly chaperone HybE, partial [Pseudomonadota bacterium]